MGNKRVKNRKKIWIYVLAGLILAAVICGGIARKSYLNGKEPAMTVNGYAVEQDEFTIFLQKQKANVISYYASEYDAETDTDDFWETEFDGQTPTDMLVQQALEELAEQKAYQADYLRLELIEDTSYHAFLNALETENEYRSDALKRGEIIYGPEQFGEMEFYSYYYSNLEIEQKNWFGEEAFSPSEEELKEHYQKLEKEGMFLNAVQGKLLFIVYDAEQAALESGIEDQLFHEIYNSVMNESLTADIPRYEETFGVSITSYEEEVDEAAASKEDGTYLQMINVLKELEEGARTEITYWEANRGIAVVLEKQPVTSKTFDEVADTVRQELLNEQFDTYLEDLVQQAEVVRNEAVLSKLAKKVIKG